MGTHESVHATWFETIVRIFNRKLKQQIKQCLLLEKN